jgi:hypothetical protein
LAAVVTGYLVGGVVTVISTGGNSTASAFWDFASSSGKNASNSPKIGGRTH